MQSVLGQTATTLHEANEATNADEQHTIPDGLKLLPGYGPTLGQSGVVEEGGEPPT